MMFIIFSTPSFQLTVWLVYLKSGEIEEISICQFATHFTAHLKMDRHVVILDDQNQINFVFTLALFFAASTLKGLFLFRGLALIVSDAKTYEVLLVSTGLAG